MCIITSLFEKHNQYPTVLLEYCVFRVFLSVAVAQHLACNDLDTAFVDNVLNIVTWVVFHSTPGRVTLLAGTAAHATICLA